MKTEESGTGKLFLRRSWHGEESQSEAAGLVQGGREQTMSSPTVERHRIFVLSCKCRVFLRMCLFV